MNNDNKPGLRVVESDASKREFIGLLKSAIDLVETESCIGVMISVVKDNGDLVNIVSGTEKRHIMVSAALYQLFDVAGLSEGKGGQF